MDKIDFFSSLCRGEHNADVYFVRMYNWKTVLRIRFGKKYNCRKVLWIRMVSIWIRIRIHGAEPMRIYEDFDVTKSWIFTLKIYIM